MRFEINNAGKLVLKDVTDEAWDYINSEMSHLLVYPKYQPWYFSRERFDGTVYVVVTPNETKYEFMRIIECLIERYGLTLTEPTIHLIQAWRENAKFIQSNIRSNAERQATQQRIKDLERILRKGCKGCPHLIQETLGDEAIPFCMAGESPIELETSPYTFEYGEYDRNGVLHVGQKYYPCEQCKFIK